MFRWVTTEFIHCMYDLLHRDVYNRQQLVDYKMQYNSKSYFKTSILSPIISLAMSLLLVVVIKGGATGKMAGILIGPIILYIWCIKNKMCIRDRSCLFRCGPYNYGVISAGRQRMDGKE